MVEMGRHISLAMQFSRIVLHPTVLFRGMADALIFWGRSRDWRTIRASIPVVAIIVTFYFTLISESIQNQERLVQQLQQEALTLARGQTLSNAVLNKYGAQIGSNLQSSTFTYENLRKLSIVFQRILQIIPVDTQSKYSLALIDELNGNTDGSDAMLASIARDDEPGYSPAHAIIAAKLIADINNGKVESRKKLVHHLEEAINRSDADPFFLLSYLQFVENPRSRDKVFDSLKHAASRNRDLYLQLALAANQMGLVNDVQFAAEKGIVHFESRIAANPSVLNDWVALSKCHVLLGAFDAARKTLEDALSNTELNQSLIRRELSEVYLAEFHSKRSKSAEDSDVHLDLLDSAALADPSNARVAEEASRLLLSDTKPTAPLREVLKQHIQNKTASFETFLNISKKCTKCNKFPDAIQYLEHALAKQPSNIEAQSSLALLLARHQPEKISRAVELIKKVYAVASTDIEVIDSYGEILIIAQRPSEAIQLLTEAVNANVLRIETRTLLIRALDEAGFTELAQAQRDKLHEIQIDSF